MRLDRALSGVWRCAYIGRGFGGSGCGFSNGFTLFNPEPAFHFLLRLDAFAFFAFSGVAPLFTFSLLALLRSASQHTPVNATSAPIQGEPTLKRHAPVFATLAAKREPREPPLSPSRPAQPANFSTSR
jgi:hypothetical protein